MVSKGRFLGADFSVLILASIVALVLAFSAGIAGAAEGELVSAPTMATIKKGLLVG
jgi:hypothetical protein